MHRLLTPLVWAIALLAGCGQPDQRAARHNTDANANGTPQIQTHCYLRTTHMPQDSVDGTIIPGTVDSLYIRLDILGNLANGVYAWLPQKQDQMKGSFQGSLEGNLVTAIYTYTLEGETGKKEVLFKVEDGRLRVGTGDMEVVEGVNLFMDKSQVSFSEAVPEVDCM